LFITNLFFLSQNGHKNKWMDDKLIDYYRPPLVRMNISFLKHTMTYNFFKRHYNKLSRQIWKIKYKKECLTQNHLKWC